MYNSLKGVYCFLLLFGNVMRMLGILVRININYLEYYRIVIQRYKNIFLQVSF